MDLNKETADANSKYVQMISRLKKVKRDQFGAMEADYSSAIDKHKPLVKNHSAYDPHLDSSHRVFI